MSEYNDAVAKLYRAAKLALEANMSPRSRSSVALRLAIEAYELSLMGEAPRSLAEKCVGGWVEGEP